MTIPSEPAGGRDRFLAEILEQPAVLRRAGDAMVAQRDRLDRVVQGAAGPGPVVLTGMGGSLDACHAAATFLATAGVMAAVRGAGELLHYGLPALTGGGLLVVVSQSGESAEVVRLAGAVREIPGRPLTVAVTNGLDTPLGRLSDVTIDTRAGEERAPSTMTFVASLVALSGVARAIIAGRGGAGEADMAALAAGIRVDAVAAADAVAGLLAEPERTADALADRLGGGRGFVALGRGTGLAAAEMGALILTESVGMPAISHETGDFRHGPLEIAGPGLAAAIVALDAHTVALDLALAEALALAGVALLFVSSDGIGPAAAAHIAIGPLDPMVAPAAAVVPFQLLAWRLAVRAGRLPGELLRASKVTRDE